MSQEIISGLIGGAVMVVLTAIPLIWQASRFHAKTETRLNHLEGATKECRDLHLAAVREIRALDTKLDGHLADQASRLARIEESVLLLAPPSR